MNNLILGASAKLMTGANTIMQVDSGSAILKNIISTAKGCVIFLGGFLIVWGAVQLGLAIREQQGGGQIASSLATIAGGAIVCAAAFFFSSLDTSWLKD